MALVTVADLRKYMSDISLSSKQMDMAQLALDAAQQALETYLGRPVQPVQVREKRRSNSAGDLVLSVTPVHQVLSVRLSSATENTIPTDPTPIALTASDIDRLWDAAPTSYNIVPGGVYVGRSRTYYVIEYIGGYNGYADDFLKNQILEVASRTMTVNHDDTLTIKGDMAQEPSGAQQIKKGWTEDELKQFDRLRRRVVVRG